MEKTCEASIVVSWKGGEWDNGIVHPVQMSLIYTLLQIQISDKRISGANATKGSSPTDWSEIGSAAHLHLPPPRYLHYPPLMVSATKRHNIDQVLLVLGRSAGL